MVGVQKIPGGLALLAMVVALLSVTVHAQTEQAERIRNAAIVLDEIMSAGDQAIPSGVLSRAEGVAVFPCRG